MCAVVTRRVGDLCEQLRGVSYSKSDSTLSYQAGYKAILRANNITKHGLTFDDLVYVPDACISERQLLKAGDVVIAASSGSLDVVGKAARVENDLTAGFGAFCKVLRPNSLVDAGYFAHFFQTSNYRRKISSLAAGANINNLRNEHLDNLEIRVPSLPEQRRIAAILDKADALRAQRRASIAKLDELLQSVFIEMFGDPVMNPKGWAIGSLSTYGSFKNGLNFGKDESGVNIRYVGVGNFKSKAALKDFGNLAFIELNKLPAEDYFLHDGDLLFVRSNGNRELVGRCMAVYPGMEKVTYSGFCIRYRIADVSLQLTYVAHLFRSVPFRRLIFQGGQGANIQNINQQILSDLPIPIPDEGLQSQFAAIVEKIGAQKQTLHRAAEKSDDFFASLQHLAFSGKL